jgi:hypothetical protein
VNVMTAGTAGTHRCPPPRATHNSDRPLPTRLTGNPDPTDHPGRNRSCDRRPFQVPRFPRTLSVWLNSIASAGLVLEAANEPFADQAAIGRHPQLETTRTAPLFLHLRCRKPTS